MKTLKSVLKIFSLLLFGLLLFSCEKEDLLLDKSKTDLKSGEKAMTIESDIVTDYIMDVIPLINELFENGYLNKGTSNALTKKIENVAASLKKDNIDAATDQLKSFISQVISFKENGFIPVQIAENITNIAGNGLIIIKGSFLDIRDGHEYKVVLMGNKIWMAENLKYLPYLSTMPADYPPDYEIQNTENPGGLYYVYQYWGSSVEEAKMTYAYKTAGVLYTHIAAVGAASPSEWPVGASPSGWHVASNEEWEQLAQYVSDIKGPYTRTESSGCPLLVTWENVGLHLKSATGWYENNGLDDFGFTAYPSGYISQKYNIIDGDNIPKWNSNWWTSTPKPEGAHDGPVFWRLSSSDYKLSNDASVFPEVGFAVRCVKD